MTTPDEEWALATRHVGRSVRVFGRIDSTNAAALALAGDPSHDGLVLLARQQTQGRGQHGRRWLSPPDSSILLSVLLFPLAAIRRPALLTAWAAVSVCELVEEVALRRPRIKWPNDVLLDGRKVCGILIEQQTGTVAGIGLNVAQTPEEFQAAGLPEATSLRAFTGQPLDARELARKLIERLDAEYVALVNGELAELERRWRDLLGLQGEVVLAECADGGVAGRLTELGFDGLTLEVEGGERRRLVPEAVRHLHRA